MKTVSEQLLDTLRAAHERSRQGYSISDELARAVTEAEALLAVPELGTCDGNHGGPRCADPECWNDSPPASDPLKDNQIAALVNKVCRLAREFHNHDSLRQRIAQELVPALKAAQQQAEPIPMVLHCPKCGMQHIDGEEWENDPHDIEQGQIRTWKNEPHRSHLCHNPTCRTIWRPADVPTTGVKVVSTKGKADTWEPGQATPEPSRGMIGMGAQALAGELADALDKDTQSENSLGMLGANTMAWLRKVSAEYLSKGPAKNPCRGITDTDCGYLSTCGAICNKCGKEHRGQVQATPEPVPADQAKWCEYVAGMVDCWVSAEWSDYHHKDEDRRVKAIAGIIERRLWALQKQAAATPEPVQADSSEHLRVIASMGAALRRLSFAAQTSGGTAGPDAELQAAIGQADQALSFGGIAQAMFATPPQQAAGEPVGEPALWVLTKQLDQRETTTRGYLWFSNPQNDLWTPLYTHPAPGVPEAWTDEQCLEFMCVALRHVEYKRGTKGPTCDDIRLGVARALAAAQAKGAGHA